MKSTTLFFYFYCYTMHVVELLNYYTNHCTYIKFTHENIKNAPTCFGPKTIIRELYLAKVTLEIVIF